jgi:hypothetical protein
MVGLSQKKSEKVISELIEFFAEETGKLILIINI